MKEIKTVDKTESESFLVDLLKPTVESLRSVDKRAKCNCPMPFVRRKWHDALGTYAELRLCCVAKALEEHLGVTAGTFIRFVEFEPTWEWDEDELVDHPVQGKKPVKAPRGAPPQWLKDRMERKGIKTLKREAD